MTKQDLRIIKTNNAIRKAFEELLAEKSFDEMSVRDIAEKAMINRGTFYLHYKDKNDLLEKIEKEELEKLRVLSSQFNKEDLKQSFLENRPFEGVVEALRYFKQNSATLKLIINRATEISFHRQAVIYLFDSIWDNIGAGAHKSDRDYRIIAMLSACSAIIREWINSGTKEEEEYIATLLTNVVTASMLAEELKNM